MHEGQTKLFPLTSLIPPLELNQITSTVYQNKPLLSAHTISEKSSKNSNIALLSTYLTNPVMRRRKRKYAKNKTCNGAQIVPRRPPTSTTEGSAVLNQRFCRHLGKGRICDAQTPVLSPKPPHHHLFVLKFRDPQVRLYIYLSPHQLWLVSCNDGRGMCLEQWWSWW